MKLDTSKARCVVHVYREGALSAVGHDLEIEAGELKLDVSTEPPRIEAEIRADSLRVVGTLRGGHVAKGEPSGRDKRDIEESIRTKILEAAKYPTITFRSTSIDEAADGYRVTGQLGLRGHTKSIAFVVARSKGRLETEVSLHQPDFGIKPYSAMMGLLRVKADVVVKASVPFESA
jgi:polyisoprenoid-binding protein YceI